MMWDPSNPEVRRRVQNAEARMQEEQRRSRGPRAPRRRDRLGLAALVIVALLIVGWVVYLLHTGTLGPLPVPTPPQ
jgi:hypothetical protein